MSQGHTVKNSENLHLPKHSRFVHLTEKAPKLFTMQSAMSAQKSPTCNNFEELLLQGYLIDAVLNVQGVKFKVHKILLCNICPYFKALFARWSDVDRRVFNIPGLSPEMMQLILQFAYTSDVSVTEQNVHELVLAANQFNIMGILEICSNFLMEHLCPENCVGLWQFTNVFMLPRLRDAADSYILCHFQEVVGGQEFLQLTVQELTDILGRDDLNARLESTVYEGVIRWISCMPAERQEHTFTLLSKVRLTLLSAEYIMSKVLSCSLVTNNYECWKLAKNALKVIRSYPDYETHPSTYNYYFHTRLPNSCLLATGGSNGGNPTNVIESYDYRTNAWVSVENTQPPRAYHGTAFLDGAVYFIGGFDRQRYFNSVHRFDPVRHQWTEVAPMHESRCYVSVTVLNGSIYALGGYDGRNRLYTVEVYCPQTNQWSFIARMHMRRSNAGCAALNNKVYICGGFTGHHCLQTAECYDPTTNQWTMIAAMNTLRGGLGVIAYANQVFAVGGFDGNNRLQCAESYDPHTDTWRSVSPMITARSNFGTEVLDGRLFVAGGFIGFSTTQNSECYDATLNEWREIRALTTHRSGLSCCVISGLPNISEYAAYDNTLPHGCLEESCSDSPINVEEENEEAGASGVPGIDI